MYPIPIYYNSGITSLTLATISHDDDTNSSANMAALLQQRNMSSQTGWKQVHILARYKPEFSTYCDLELGNFQMIN